MSRSCPGEKTVALEIGCTSSSPWCGDGARIVLSWALDSKHAASRDAQGPSLVCCRVKPHAGYRKHWPKGSRGSGTEEEVALGWGFDLKLVEGRQNSRRGFLTIVLGSAVLIMFISMGSGQETDKVTGPDSRIKPKSQAQWHILVTPVFERQKQEDCFKFKASLATY